MLGGNGNNVDYIFMFVICKPGKINLVLPTKKLTLRMLMQKGVAFFELECIYKVKINFSVLPNILQPIFPLSVCFI